MHGGENLDVCQRIQPVPTREAPLRQVHDELLELLRLLLGEKVEVLRGPRACDREVRELAPVHPVGVRDDPALRGLAEDRRQADGRDTRDSQEVLQDRPRPHRGQLIRVAHQEERGGEGNRLEQVVGEQDIDHGRLIHDHEVGLQRIPGVPLEPPFARVPFQQPMERARLVPGDLGQPLRGAPRGRGEMHPEPLRLQEPDHRLENGRLPRSRAAREDEQLLLERQPDRLALLLGQGKPGLLLDPGQRLIHVDRRHGGAPEGDLLPDARAGSRTHGAR